MNRKRYCRLLALTLCLVLALTACGGTAESGEQGGGRKKYAIIAALEAEEDVIRDELQNRQETELLGMPTYFGTIGSCDVIVMLCGMGKVSAGIGTQALIDYYHPDYVINTGCSGALSQELDVGDVVLSESVVEWDLDLRAIGYPLGYIDALGCVEMEASSELCDAMEAVTPEGTTVVRGLIVSGDQFVSTGDQRRMILENFPAALCCEMESAAVGHACIQNGVPFCVVRTMSDNANGDSGVSFAEFSVEAGRKSAAWIVNMLKNQ